MHVDLILFSTLNGLAGRSAFLDAVIIFFAGYSQYVWALLFAGLFIWRSRWRMTIVVATVAGLIARLGVKPILLLFVARQRPYAALSGVHTLIPPPAGEVLQSFPSGHALFFFALATIIYAHNRRAGWIAFVAALLMGIARVAAGLHWPSDILGGAILGILTASAVQYYANHFQWMKQN